jgi:hypothetical protein
MTLEEKFPNAHPDFFKLYRKISKAAEGVDLFLVIGAAHEIMAQALAYVAEERPEFKRKFAEQLHMTADWCEFKPADALCASWTDAECLAWIARHKGDAA